MLVSGENNMSVDTRYLLEVFRLEYTDRLNEVIGEAEVFDSEGNLILSPDLKVRHKKSGYEYTIAQIKGDEPGKIQIVLREPNEPRFDPPPEGEEILGGPDMDAVLKEQDPASSRIPDLFSPPEEAGEKVVIDQEPPEEVVFVIDQEEFEKEYEVD